MVSKNSISNFLVLGVLFLVCSNFTCRKALDVVGNELTSKKWKIIGRGEPFMIRFSVNDNEVIDNKNAKVGNYNFKKKAVESFTPAINNIDGNEIDIEFNIIVWYDYTPWTKIGYFKGKLEQDPFTGQRKIRGTRYELTDHTKEIEDFTAL